MMKNRRTAPAKPMTTKAPAEQVVKDIRRATRKLHSSEEKIRIVLSGLRGEDSIAELCRKENIAQSLYYVTARLGPPFRPRWPDLGRVSSSKATIRRCG